MGGLDVLTILRKEDGLTREDLYSRVKHLINKSSFSNNLKSLINSKDIYKIEKTKWEEGVKIIIIRFYLL